MPIRFPLVALFNLYILTLFFLLSCSGSNPIAPSNTAELEDHSTLGSTQDGGAFYSSSRTIDSEPYAPDEVLVSLRDELIPEIDIGTHPGIIANVNSLLTQHGLDLKKTIDDGRTTIYVLKILDGATVPEKIAELESLPIVDNVEPNLRFEFCDVPYTPNDGFWENPNDGDDDPRTTVFEQFGPSKVGANVVWNDTFGNPSVVVCVMDSGVQVWHQDLENVMWINAGEIPDNEIDDDNNGYVDDIYGWDTKDDDNDITEYSGDVWYHGTACAGVVAAEIDNELGCTGIAPGCKIMGIRIGFGSAFLSEVLDGVMYARNNGADIISMSFSTETYSAFFNSSMNNAWYDGLIMVASAGNDDNQVLHYPAAFDAVICVGATTPFANRWTYEPIDEVRVTGSLGFYWGSCYGPQIEIVAFGENYITTHGGNDHKYWDGVNDFFFRGTSNSCPMVAGGFALLRSMHPYQTNQWHRDRMRDTSDDLDAPGFDEETGWGRINLVRACYGADRYSAEEDEDGFVDLAAHDNQVIDSIHAVTGSYTDTKDLYKFTATENGHLNFFLDIWSWGEDLDLMLYSSPTLDPSTQIDKSATENHAWNSHEVVGVACVAGETYYIQIIPADYGDSTAYTITVEYVEPYLELEIDVYDPGFTHLSGNNILLGHLDFSSGLRTHITELIFNLSGTMPANKLTELSLYKDTYVNGYFDSLDNHVADAALFNTNRVIFTNLYEEIASCTGLTRYYLFADISGVTVDAEYELVLTSYKDVSTYEGIEIAYNSFPYSFGPYEVGVDIEPPDWNDTVGAQHTHPRYEGAAIFWNAASDPRTPPVEYNVYWDTDLPFEFSTTLSEPDVNFWEAEDYDYGWIIPDLENYQEYFVAVRAIDQAGNEDENVVHMSVIPDDVADPTWPQVVGSYNDWYNAREVVADPANQRVFVADQSQGLLIIDVSDPTEPALVDSLVAGAAKGIDYDGTYVYIAYGSGLMIVDPDALDGPESVSTVPFDNALRVLVNGNWAYVTKNGTDLLPVDVSDPANPVGYPTVTSGNVGYGLYIQDNYLYVATFSKPRVFDISDPSAPVEVAGDFGATQGHDALAIDDLLYVAYWNDRKFSIYDIIDPTDPVYLGDWKSNSGYRGSTVVMFNGYIYFGTQSWGIEVLDVTDPGNILEVGQIRTRGPDGMDTDGVFIYSAENEHGLKIIL